MTMLAMFLVYWLSTLESFADKQFSATACMCVAVLSCLLYGCMFAVTFHNFHPPRWLRSFLGF